MAHLIINDHQTRNQEPGSKKQETGTSNQEAGSRKQEAGSRTLGEKSQLFNLLIP